MVEGRRKRSPAAGVSKKFSDGEWDALVEAFRENPGATTVVSEITGIKRARVVRAWHHGYPHQGREAISAILNADKILARAKRAEMTAGEEPEKSATQPVSPGRHDDDEPRAVVVSSEHKRVMAAMVERDKQRRKALEDSARTRAEEGSLIQISRRNVMQLSVVAAKILRGAEKLAARMETQLNKQNDLPLKDAMSLIQKASVVVRLGTEAGKMAVQMERLAMGQPIGDGTEIAGTGKLSPDDAERWIEMTMRALERSKRRQRINEEDEDDAEEASPDHGVAVAAAAKQLAPDAGTVRLGHRADDLN